MTVRIIPEAREELSEAFEFYRLIDFELGNRFRDEVGKIIESLKEDPYRWRQRREGHRRINCATFPYYVAYRIREDEIVVVAIGHGARRPGYWRGRRIS